MPSLKLRRAPAAVLVGLACATPFVVLAAPPARSPAARPAEKKEEEKKPAAPKDEEIVVLSPFCVSGGADVGYAASSTLGGTRIAAQFGATPGGAQDIRYFRDVAASGGFPHPATITAEGLFSEHDLPLRATPRSKDLLILTGEGMPAELLTRGDVRYLAQIGFASGLDPATWRRDPLNLVAVVDKSGSMSGHPLDLVKRSLHQVLQQLGPDDQLSVVLYGDRSHVHLAPTRTTAENRGAIATAIDAIESAGSTNMEAGLRVGFELARESQKTFRGRTRVMQFTDERPNVGDTSAAGFMGLMEAASHDGIGQTTIGVGVQFGAELAAKVSTVRGGNLFFFPDEEAMAKTFTEELDTMVTELVHDLDVVIRPAPGLKIAGVYGVPGEVLKWEGGRNVRFAVTTIFLSRKKGAIYAAFAPEDEDLPARAYGEGSPLAEVRLSYREVGATRATASRLALPLVPAAQASTGLQRGRLLVDEYLALKAAMTAHLVQNDQEKAFALLGELQAQLRDRDDAALAGERKLVDGLLAAMAKLSGHGENVAATTRGATVGEDDEVIFLDPPHCGAFSRDRAVPQRRGRR